MEEPILLVNKKDITESGLELFLQAAVKTGCYKIAKHLIDIGVDIHSVYTTIYQANRPLFITTEMRNIDNVRDLLRCSESEVGNYKLDLIPLYISGDNAFSKIIKAIVNNKTSTARTNVLPENKSNTEVLTATNNEETINKMISKYAENIHNEDKLQIRELVVLERNFNNILKDPFPTINNDVYRSHNIPNDNSEFILIKYNFDDTDEIGSSITEDLEHDYMFEYYKRVVSPTQLDITNLDAFENINNSHDVSIYNYWSIKLEALHSKFLLNFLPNSKGLFMIFNPLTKDEVKNLTNCTVMENCTLLHIAADEGCEQILNLILNRGGNANTIDKKNNTPLHFAVSKGHEKIVNLLLTCAVDVNCKNVYDITPLHYAAINGDEEICRALLNKGANIDAITGIYNSPLHFAVWNGNQKIVKLFLECEANVNLEDIDGTTALHFAAYKGNEDIVHMLLEKGADINAVTKYHNTPFHFAVINGHSNVLKYLSESGADITIKDDDGITALHLATYNGKKDICLYLLNKGLDVNTPARYNLSTIHFAVISDNEETFKLISKHCSDLNVKDGIGRTPLHLATKQNNVNAIKFLLECGVNVNAEDFKGVTPLHIAVKEGFFKIVELLLSKGADINIKLSNGFTCFHIISNYSIHWLELFLNYLNDVNFRFINFLHCASYYFKRVQNYFNTVELLLSYGTDVNIKIKNEYTYITYLILSSNNFCNEQEYLGHDENDSLILMKNIIEKFVKVLLNYGATVDTIILHRTIHFGWLSISSLLLENGADVNVVIENETPFEHSKTYYPPQYMSINMFLDLANIDVERRAQNFYNRFVAKHLSRMVAAGMYLNEKNLTLFTTYNIHQTCMKEIEMMKNDYICSDISVHDILTKPIDKLSVFAKKINIVQNFESAEYKSRYPIYANTLKRRAELAEENKCLRGYLINSGCIQILEIFFPFTVVNEILNFLSVVDLLNFRKVLHTSPNYDVFKWYLKYRKNTV